MNAPVDIHELFAENLQREAIGDHLKRLARKVTWQRRVKALCLAVAVFAIVWIGGRELLVVVS